MADKRREPVLLYIGIGCGVLVLLGIVLAGVLGLAGYRWAKKAQKTMDDPKLREESVKALLGCDRLPDGYQAVFPLSVPLVIDMAVLMEQPAEAGSGGAAIGRGLIYMRMLNMGSAESEIRAFMEGRTDRSSFLESSTFHVETDETLGRGRLTLHGQPLLYVAQRGEVVEGEIRTRGVQSVMFLPCPTDNKIRVGLWFGPDPRPGERLQPEDLKGTTADEQEILRFMGQFHPCGAAPAEAPQAERQTPRPGP